MTTPRDAAESSAVSSEYVRALPRLVEVVQALSEARDVEAIAAIVRTAARDMAGADGATFVLRDGDQCHYLDEDAIGPLWKGRRFPMSTCISGWTMRHARTAVIEDIYADERIPADAYRPTFVKSLVMVPVRRRDPLGAIGHYWATRRRPSERQVAVLEALADTTAVAMANTQLYGQLRRQVQQLQEQRDRIHDQRETISTFTRAMAHDLKEPMRTIRSFIELIDRIGGLDDRQREFFDHIDGAAERMTLLIDQVSKHAELGESEQVLRTFCPLREIVENVKVNLARLIQERQATVVCSALPEVSANPGQMIQVLQNLIANAVQHGGESLVVKVDAQDAGDHWLLSVEDNGSGIDPGQWEKIFQPFHRLQRKDENTGLGLAACRRIIAYHGGRIWCESEPGRGTRFLFTLPKSVASAEPVPPA